MSLTQVRSRILTAERDAGREQGSVCLLAVSKLQPLPRIANALNAGQCHFGENRVQEAASKWPALIDQFPDTTLHLVGPLQSNKARAAMQLFSAIHSVDRVKLAHRLAGIAQELGFCPQIFVQVNTGEEPQKSGVLPKGVDELVEEIRRLELPLEGLMCIPPVNDEPALHYGLLASLARRNGLTGLSMGMSGDYETAIRIGATHVRVGSAVFGNRPAATYPQS